MLTMLTMLKMRARLASCVLVGLLFAAAPVSVRAEINMGETIDWMVRDADVIVRGVVTHVRKTRGPGSVVWYEATVRVDETLKGSKRRTVRFSMRHLYGETPAQWKSQRIELLVFLVRPQRLGKYYRPLVTAPFALRAGTQERVVKLNGLNITKVFTRSFAVLTKRNDILKATRRAVVTTVGARAKYFNVDTPFNSAAYRTLYAGSSVWMRVPVDPQLLRDARRWIRANDVQKRVQGARALGEFRSAANIAELRRLLKDPTFYVQTRTGKHKERL